jgi:hypothetical protein
MCQSEMSTEDHVSELAHFWGCRMCKSTLDSGAPEVFHDSINDHLSTALTHQVMPPAAILMADVKMRPWKVMSLLQNHTGSKLRVLVIFHINSLKCQTATKGFSCHSLPHTSSAPQQPTLPLWWRLLHSLVIISTQ